MADDIQRRLREALSKVNAEIDAAYWRFTRQARGQPVPGYLYVIRNALEIAIYGRIREH